MKKKIFFPDISSKRIQMEISTKKLSSRGLNLLIMCNLSLIKTKYRKITYRKVIIYPCFKPRMKMELV